MDDLVAAILRGDPVEWPPDGGRLEQQRFLEAAERHGVLPLVAHQLHRTNSLARWPGALQESFRQAARHAVVLEEMRRPELEHVLTAMAAANVRLLLMKGAGVAYLHYPSPFLRPRSDTDLLIEKDNVAVVTRVMTELGYRRSTLTSGDLVMPQRPFVKRDRSGVVHAYDFHWKIANPQPFAEALAFGELMKRSIAIAVLGAHARTLGPLDALLLACIHRVAHHRDSGRLLWLYDIHLLADEMNRNAFESFAALAAQKRVAAACAASLRLAQRWFQTKLPRDLVEALAARASAEPSAAYLGGQLRPVDILWSDLGLLGGWRAKCRLLRQHLFPPAAYMLERYASSNRVLLPALYARRILQGAGKWFRRPKRDRP